MKIEDFEKAIDALNRGIEIDEIKLQNGQVRFVYGHTDSRLLLWNWIGLAYSLDIPFPVDEPTIHELQDNFTYGLYAVSPEFDLKFKK